MKKSEIYNTIGSKDARYFQYTGEVSVSIDQQNFFYNKPICCVQVSKVEDKLILIYHEWDALSEKIKDIGQHLFSDNGYHFHVIMEKDILLLGAETKEPFGFFV